MSNNITDLNRVSRLTYSLTQSCKTLVEQGLSLEKGNSISLADILNFTSEMNEMLSVEMEGFEPDDRGVCCYLETGEMRAETSLPELDRLALAAAIRNTNGVQTKWVSKDEGGKIKDILGLEVDRGPIAKYLCGQACAYSLLKLCELNEIEVQENFKVDLPRRGKTLVPGTEGDFKIFAVRWEAGPNIKNGLARILRVHYCIGSDGGFEITSFDMSEIVQDFELSNECREEMQGIEAPDFDDIEYDGEERC